jgi:hypothetical protein
MRPIALLDSTEARSDDRSSLGGCALGFGCGSDRPRGTESLPGRGRPSGGRVTGDTAAVGLGDSGAGLAGGEGGATGAASAAAAAASPVSSVFGGKAENAVLASFHKAAMPSFSRTAS